MMGEADNPYVYTPADYLQRFVKENVTSSPSISELAKIRIQGYLAVLRTKIVAFFTIFVLRTAK
jgi:hypothetical protein